MHVAYIANGSSITYFIIFLITIYYNFFSGNEYYSTECTV